MYRPEGFPTFSDDYVPPIPESFNTIFNWGADAMLEGLKGQPIYFKTDEKMGCVPDVDAQSMLKAIHYRNGYLVFIPEE